MLGAASGIALSGVQAAQTAIQVAAHNLANSQTSGFRSSRVHFATGSRSQVRVGDAPQPSGSGVQVSAIDMNSGPATLAVDASPLSLYLSGRGLFVLEGANGQQLYSKSGEFQFNARGELVLPTGERVLGYSASEHGQADAQNLTSLSWPPEWGAARSNSLSWTVDSQGVLRAQGNDGQIYEFGQLAIAFFPNEHGLYQTQSLLGEVSPATGSPRIGTAEPDSVISGVQVLSDTDVVDNLLSLEQAELLFKASMAVMATENAMFDSLFNMWRQP